MMPLLAGYVGDLLEFWQLCCMTGGATSAYPCPCCWVPCAEQSEVGYIYEERTAQNMLRAYIAVVRGGAAAVKERALLPVLSPLLGFFGGDTAAGMHVCVCVRVCVRACV